MEVPRQRPKGCGRKKIEIKKIDDQRKRWVSFSKRKKGLLSKASRLSKLSGEEIGVVIISEQGRVYTSDNADAVIHRYRSQRDVKEGDDRNEMETTTSGLNTLALALDDINDDEEDYDNDDDGGVDIHCSSSKRFDEDDDNKDSGAGGRQYLPPRIVKERNDHDDGGTITSRSLEHQQRASTTTGDDDNGNSKNGRAVVEFFRLNDEEIEATNT
ncbi:agamous-like MADS-box protein AGL29 [Hibiscus syriacus]|uniref:agamous-like MADS-box protein AGL29 n=1 Tax=Hibiscus syriacus TaxID=106335 RepID=UPI00192404DF|nr:agamous-like MADS-box protein AGL29 [Hibiscus syriacus]